MKIGQRDVVIGIGENKPWPRKYWVIFTPRGREWISPGVIGGGRPGFWLDVPRRFEVYSPTWAFTLALTPGSRWAKMDHSLCMQGHGDKNFRNCRIAGERWIEFKRRAPRS